MNFHCNVKAHMTLKCKVVFIVSQAAAYLKFKHSVLSSSVLKFVTFTNWAAETKPSAGGWC